MSSIYYKNIFLYSSLQFCGNVEEYFSKHTEKLVVFVLMPRQQFDKSLIRLYTKGNLVEEKKIVLSKNIVAYYVLWYKYYISSLLSYFSKRERIFVISFHPISFFGMTIQKLLRNVEFVYWDPDYFPPVNLLLRFFERLKRYYNSKVQYACYLSDLINQKMNGKILKSKKKKTVMWGILPQDMKRLTNNRKFTLLFVGVIKGTEGLELLFDFLQNNRDCFVNIIGICTGNLYKNYLEIIKKNKIQSQVYFPNKFFSDAELKKISKTCQVGIALYDIDQTSATYYTDPGKIKTYASLGLPVIMSDTSAIVTYVKKFKSGKVIKSVDELSKAILEIKMHYFQYIAGLEKFNKFFYYDTFYKKAFEFLETDSYTKK